MRGSDACCAQIQRSFWDVSLDLLIAQARQVDHAVLRLAGVKADDAESPYFIWRGGSCRICAPRRGNIYRRGVDTMPPAHPNCRCYAEPYWGEVPTNADGKSLAGIPARILERPKGVPEDWIASLTKDGKGIIYTDPSSKGATYIKVQKGNPNSSQPGQRYDNVRVQKNGESYDIGGNKVPKQSQESHIPLENFKFLEWLFK